MVILEIVSGAQINGAVVHCALLSKELARRGHSVTLLCRYDAKVKQLVVGTTVKIVESDLHRFPFDEIKHISAMVRREGIQLIHTHMTRAHNFGVILRRFAGVPCVATAHSHILQPLTWMFNDHVIAVSDKTRRFQQSRNFVRTANIETVHGFTDYDRQACIPAGTRSSVRASFGLQDDTPVFGVIGDIIPRKGHLYLVRALPEIIRAVPNVRMLVVGDPKRKMGLAYYERVLQEAARLGIGEHIIWAGYRTDVPDIMTALDLYVMASLDEMFPVAALEAMAARRPIVATNVGGIPECLTHESTALLVPPSNSQALASAIATLLVDRELANRLAESAHDLVRAQFSVQSQTTRIEQVFQRVLERHGPIRAADGAAGTLP